MKWWPLQTRKGLKVVVGLHPWQTSQPILTSSCITTNSLLVPYHIRSLDLQKHTVQFFLNFSILLHQHSQNKHPICTALSWYEAIRSIPQASFHTTRLTSILCNWDVRYVIWTKSLFTLDPSIVAFTYSLLILCTSWFPTCPPSIPSFSLLIFFIHKNLKVLLLPPHQTPCTH